MLNQSALQQLVCRYLPPLLEKMRELPKGNQAEMLIITACLAGVLIGLNFNVAVLLPLAVAGGGIHALAYGVRGPAAIGTDMFVLTFSLEAGYMIGLTGRAMFAQILTRLNIAPSKEV